jgi:hypothetical protein
VRSTLRAVPAKVPDPFLNLFNVSRRQVLRISHRKVTGLWLLAKKAGPIWGSVWQFRIENAKPGPYLPLPTNLLGYPCQSVR